MNLTKYFMIKAPMDDTFGPADIPAVWNLKPSTSGTRAPLPNYAGDTHDVHSVMIDSALGVLGAAPANKADFLAQVKWLQDYLSRPAAAEIPLPGRCRPGRGRQAVFDAHCAACHASERTGTRCPWPRWAPTPAASTPGTRALGDQGQPGGGEHGHHAAGWWRKTCRLQDPLPRRHLAAAPYLHNGAVPTLRDLLEPVERRPRVFWRGYDVFDPVKVGFVTDGDEAKRVGTRMDVTASKGQWQPGARVRHRAAGGRQGGAGGVSEDLVPAPSPASGFTRKPPRGAARASWCRC
jgi:hypothetical protein